MNIEALVKMANQISSFAVGEAGDDHPEQSAEMVALHLRRYWEPRMRTQMIEHFNANGGEGLDENARQGVALLAAGKVG